MSATNPPIEPADPLDPLDPHDAETARAAASPTPQLYVACPLTGLDTDPKRLESTSNRIDVVKRAVDDMTQGNRVPAESWPVRLHVPFDKSRPGSGDGLGPGTVYSLNLDALLASDGLIVVADEHCSAGIGQEIEWAARAGIPVLYISQVAASRQILGAPHNIDGRVGVVADDIAAHVRNWLQKNRLQIINGPTRRADREFAYIELTEQLKLAWRQSTEKTPQAAQLNLHPSAIDSMVESPLRVALMPWWTICELAVLLSVNLEARRGLDFAESRAWVKAAEEGGWDERTVERLRIFAATSGATDLDQPAAWRFLHAQVFGLPD